jgi:hypothetical protein
MVLHLTIQSPVHVTALHIVGPLMPTRVHK